MKMRIAEPAPTPVTTPVTETKADAFRRLATKRVTVAVRYIRLVGNMSSRASYEYTPEQVEKIRAALNDAVESTMARFDQTHRAAPSIEL